jgi:hypothetical protein
MLSPTRPAHSQISAGPVLKPCFDGGLPPEQQATCSPVMLWKMPEIPETVYASPRFGISTLEKRVVLQELIDAQPGIAVISGLGSSDRVRDGHEFPSSDSRPIDLFGPPKTAPGISAGNNPSNHFLLLSVSRSGGAQVNPRPDPIVPRRPR